MDTWLLVGVYCLLRWIEWLRDRWRHMTLNGQAPNPNMFATYHLENDWRQRLGYNGAPIGNDIYGESNGHVTDNVTQPVDLVCVGMI